MMDLKYLRNALLICALLFFGCDETTDTKETKTTESDTTSKVEEPETYDSEPSVFQLLSPKESGIKFSNNIKESNAANRLNFDYMYNGAGVGLGDINNDGLEDIFFTANMVSDRLYLNRGKLKFQNISKKAGIDKVEGWSTGVSMADVNNDGWLDIYVCRAGPIDEAAQTTNQLYINNKDLTFTESGAEYGLDYTGRSSQAAFFDYDKDGDLDMYLITHPKEFTRGMNNVKLAQMEAAGTIEMDRFYRNDGNKFVEISKEAGIKSSGYGLGVSVSDYNFDGWPDVFVSNDYAQGDYMWINDKKGGFSNEALSRLKHTAHSSMGCDVADINNDGFQDLMACDMAFETRERSKRNMASMDVDRFHGFVKIGWNYEYMRNVLQLSNGMGSYNDIGQLAGVSSTDWSWCPLIADFDNDGWSDLFVSNGNLKDANDNDWKTKFEERRKANPNVSLEDALNLIPSVKLKNYIFSNNGDLTFSRRNKDWGLREKVNTNGAAYADLDNDGDLDLVLNNLDEQSSVYKNISNDGGGKNYLEVKLKGNNKTLADGAFVKLLHNGQQQVRECRPIRGYLSSMGQKLHFGLSTNSVDSMLVYWPNGDIRLFTNVASNQIKEINISEGKKVNARDLEPKTKTMLTDVTENVGLDLVHTENEYNDFEMEILLPHKMSEHGPHTSSGDINGDGLDDIFVGGAAGTAAAIFMQNADGTFSRSGNPVFDQDKIHEDMGSVIFDCDSDGDMDIYVVSGGNELPVGDSYYNDRLYINEGGSMVRSSDLPLVNSSGMRVIAVDYDADGDKDLFVGGRVKAQLYPHAPKSYLLQNDKGKFTDVTASVIPDFENCGMITDLKSFDYEGDGDIDILVTGEWMAPKIFKNNGSSFEDISATAMPSNKEGWWLSAEVADLDGDGDMDFIAGNIGMNNKFHPTEKKPFKVYASDFDNNGTNDIVLAKYDGEKLYPSRGKECSTEQMPFVSEKFPTYEGFANATMDEVYSEEKLAKALSLEVREFHSGIFWNDGGKFRYEELPHEAQMSAVQDIHSQDMNGDGKLDLIIVGNMYGAEVETIRYDASDGLVLLNRGDSFEPVPGPSSGLNLPFNTRDIEVIKTAKGELLIVTSNNGPLKSYMLN